MGEIQTEPAEDVRVQRESDLSLLEEATQLRRSIVRALYRAGGGHFGGCLSVIDLLLTLYRRELRVSPDVPDHPRRDRLILSKGHAALALYAVLAKLGFFDHPLESYGTLASPLEGHPDMTNLPALDFSSGSLGQGLSVGMGMALGLRATGQHVWVVLGDGECQEGQVWEAATLAARCGLGNLHAIVDHNRFQEWGWNRSSDGTVPPPMDELPRKWAAFGWNVLTADGHSFEELESAFTKTRQSDSVPTIVVAHTIKGKGFPLIEADPLRFHCGNLTAAEHLALIGPNVVAS